MIKNLPKQLKQNLARIPTTGRVFGGGLLSLLAVPAFAAGDDMSGAVVSAITGTNSQIVAVVGAMAGALVLIVAWGLIRRAMGK